jgi:membrane-bound lytic murein transglycosylase D
MSLIFAAKIQLSKISATILPNNTFFLIFAHHKTIFNLIVNYMKRFLIYITLLIGLISSVISSVSAQEPPEKANSTGEFDQHLIQEMDDMLNLWYVKREVANAKSVLSKLKDVDSSSIVHSDSLVALRVKEMGTVIPISYNEYVKPYINLYVIKRQRSSAALLGLAQYYYPIMQEIFDKYGVPEELIYLTIIESGLNPTAVSRAGATGIWQFMYATGKMYGLDVNTFIDERRDAIEATDAAARHLRDLHNMFNDWGLAISAYNCGPGNVRKAIARSGNKSDFWGVRPFLPRETQNYFPAFIGAFYMMKYHNLYGIKPAKITIPSDVDTIMIGHEVHLEQIAHVLNINIDEIKTLNPQYKLDIIPAYADTYPLRLRNKDIIRFIDRKDSIYAYNRDTYFLPVKNQESSFTGSGGTTAQASKSSAKPTSNSSSKPKSSATVYIVKKGDTLSSIAKKYRIETKRLASYNGLSNVHKLSIGQRLKIPKK